MITPPPATFVAMGIKFTVVEGGKGYEKDSISMNDGLGEYPVSLFDGDVVINGN